MLYRPEAFEPLTETDWDERRVREAIHAVVADADRAFDLETLWPADEWDGWQAALPLKNLYVGAAGVIWALDVLRRRGHADPRIDLAAAAIRTLDAFRTESDFIAVEELPSPRDSALLTGETGILLVTWRLAPSADLERDLLARVLANLDNDADDLMWGTPGTLVAARAMTGWTARNAGATPGAQASKPCGTDAIRTASGCNASTASPRAASARFTASSGTRSFFSTASTRNGAGD